MLMCFKRVCTFVFLLVLQFTVVDTYSDAVCSVGCFSVFVMKGCGNTGDRKVFLTYETEFVLF